ncbi:MAG: efflux RND transporter permease subunit [Kiritimatiellia bacterium]
MAREIRRIMKDSPGVVDVDWYVEEAQPRSRFVIDGRKAALHGISAEAIAQTLRIAAGGHSVDLLHQPDEKEDVDIVLQLPRALRENPSDLLAMRIRSGDGNALPEPGATSGLPPLIPLGELMRVEEETVEHSIHHKNLMPVTYVIGDVAGVVESPFYAIQAMNREIAKIDARTFGGASAELPVFNINMPFRDDQPALKWDGEWHITLEVFRDLGLAFGAVCVLIYVLMVGWFKSFLTPVVVMAAIPFSLVGILPAHGAMDAFFTATSMIGFMAGAGIVVRNSIILVDFIELRVAEGMPLQEAVIDAGAVRFRPMMLTALAVVVGAGVILFDPIFQGLAIALMAGEIASLFISRMAVPVLYYMSQARR